MTQSHSKAGPFTIVTPSGPLPPSDDRHDYTSVAVYYWPCARLPGHGSCDVASCARSACNCSSVDVCGKSGPACNGTTGLPWQSCDGHENRKEIAVGGLLPLTGMAAAVNALAAGFYWTRNETCVNAPHVVLRPYPLPFPSPNRSVVRAEARRPFSTIQPGARTWHARAILTQHPYPSHCKQVCRSCRAADLHVLLGGSNRDEPKL